MLPAHILHITPILQPYYTSYYIHFTDEKTEAQKGVR